MVGVVVVVVAVVVVTVVNLGAVSGWLVGCAHHQSHVDTALRAT